MGLLSAGSKGWPGGGRDDRSLVLQGGGGGGGTLQQGQARPESDFCIVVFVCVTVSQRLAL